MTARAHGVNVESLSKTYGETKAVADVSFDVRPGALMTLLGPSGCGKTTTLRMIGGLIAPTAGRIEISGRDVTELPPWQRHCGFVFQSYALFPHMSIRDNIAYGLIVRGWPRPRIDAKVKAVAEMLDIGGLIERRPKELSGGQQQRAAVARALAIEPEVMLMDEPLANLDAQLRERIRFEIRRLQRELGITIIYVTHDQSEAFALSDEILVMNEGRMEQRGKPQEIFTAPASAFVAGFVGNNNLLRGEVRSIDEDKVELRWGDVRWQGQPAQAFAPHQEGLAVIGTQDFVVHDETGGAASAATVNCVSGRIEDISFVGTHYRLGLNTPAGSIVIELPKGDVEGRSLVLGDHLTLRADNVFILHTGECAKPAILSGAHRP